MGRNPTQSEDRGAAAEGTPMDAPSPANRSSSALPVYHRTTTASSLIVVRDIQHVAASLAVDGVRFMALQPALRARIEHVAARAEHGMRQAKEQGDPDDHHGDREQLAAGADERDIAEAGGRERRNREVESIDEVLDLRIDPVL